MSDGRDLLAFKAGRAFRREGTNFVDPSPTKGAISLQHGEDGLLHFLWRNRTTNEVDEDLILFPSDATFTKVSQSSWGRTYVLKFSSSNQRHFFWMQAASAHMDDEFVRHINRFLENPGYIPIWDTSPAASTSSAAAPGSAEEMARLQDVLNSFQQGGAGTESHISDVELSDILTPENLDSLFTSHPELIAALFPHLPPDLPTPPSVEALQRIIHSPPFRTAVRGFDQALRTGLLGSLVTQLGLPDEAGTGVEAFLRAVTEQAAEEDEDEEDQMETD